MADQSEAAAWLGDPRTFGAGIEAVERIEATGDVEHVAAAAQLHMKNS